MFPDGDDCSTVQPCLNSFLKLCDDNDDEGNKGRLSLVGRILVDVLDFVVIDDGNGTSNENDEVICIS